MFSGLPKTQSQNAVCTNRYTYVVHEILYLCAPRYSAFNIRYRSSDIKSNLLQLGDLCRWIVANVEKAVKMDFCLSDQPGKNILNRAKVFNVNN